MKILPDPVQARLEGRMARVRLGTTGIPAVTEWAPRRLIANDAGSASIASIDMRHLTAPVTPLANERCSAKKTTTAGSEAMSTASMSTP